MTIVLFSAATVSVVQFRLEFIGALVRDGAHVVVIAPEDSLEHRYIIEKAGAEFKPIMMQRTGMNPFRDVPLLIQLRRILRSLGYCHLVCYAHKPVIYGVLMAGRRPGAHVWAMLSGLGYAFTGHGMRRGLARSLFQIVYPVVLRKVNGLFLLNHDDRRTLIESKILYPDVPVAVLRGEGVSMSSYPQAILQLGIIPQFLLIARLLGDKGIREYVEAARRIKAQYPNIEFHLVGPTDLNPAAIKLGEVEIWQREGVIVYHGSQNDVRPFLRDCSVYVLPSYREGTPRTVLEAMATGRPVITTDAPGCRETIFDTGPADTDGVRAGRNGFLVPVKSVDALVAAMRRFIEDPTLAGRMGAEGRRLAEEYYDVHKVNQQIMEFMGLAAMPADKRDDEREN